MDKPEPRPTGNQWDVYAEQARLQLPAAPEGLLNGYVRWAPWVAIVFGVFGLLLLVVLGGILTVLSPLLLLGGAEGIQGGASAFFALAIGIVLAALELVGGYMMLNRRLTGWWILAVGIILNVLRSLLTFSILGLILSLAVAYVHLHVKPRYV